MDKTDTEYIVEHLKSSGEPACCPGRLSGAEHDSVPVLAEPSRLGDAHEAAVWRSWDGLTRAAVAPLQGTLLPAPWAACVLSGYLEAAAASQATGWLYLERWSLLGPGMGFSGPWEDSFFSESCLFSDLFWPVLLLPF